MTKFQIKCEKLETETRILELENTLKRSAFTTNMKAKTRMPEPPVKFVRREVMNEPSNLFLNTGALTEIEQEVFSKGTEYRSTKVFSA